MQSASTTAHVRSTGSGCGCGLPRHKTATCKDRFEKRLCAYSVVAGDSLYRHSTFRSERTALCRCGKITVEGSSGLVVGLACHVPCTTETEADARCGLSYGQIVCAVASAPSAEIFPEVVCTFCTYILYGRFVRTTRRRRKAPKCAGETVLRFPPTLSPHGRHKEKIQRFKYVYFNVCCHPGLCL